MKTFGQQIRELREKQDLSLREFAKKLGDLSAAFVSDIELGRRFPSDKVLEKMAPILKVSVDDLRHYDPRPSLEELRRLATSNATYGFALRKVATGEITAEDLMSLAKRKHQRNK
jgi:transcriptional regulator with XRE-family HTH domain